MPAQCAWDSLAPACAAWWRRRGAAVASGRRVLTMLTWDWHKRRHYPGMFEQNLAHVAAFAVLADPAFRTAIALNGPAPLRGVEWAGRALPQLTWPNVLVARRPNACFQFGSYGDLLGLVAAHPPWGGRPIAEEYAYVVLLAASSRGPFVPPAVRLRVTWPSILLAPLVADPHAVAVGPTVNCLPAPHVQGFAMALRGGGVAWLRRQTPAFTCHAHQGLDIRYGGMGASRRLIEAADSSTVAIHPLQWGYTSFRFSRAPSRPIDGMAALPHARIRGCLDQWIGDPHDRIPLPIETLFVKTEKSLPGGVYRALNARELAIATEAAIQQDAADAADPVTRDARPYAGAHNVRGAVPEGEAATTPPGTYAVWTVLGWVVEDADTPRGLPLAGTWEGAGALTFTPVDDPSAPPAA